MMGKERFKASDKENRKFDEQDKVTKRKVAVGKI